MKKIWFFLKFIGGILLLIYSFLAIICLLMSICLLLGGQGSNSMMEQGKDWLYSHSLISLFLLIMILPGIIIKYWDCLKKAIEKRREENKALYLGRHR